MSDRQRFQEYAGKWIALLKHTDTVIAADDDLGKLPSRVEERGISFFETEVMRIEGNGESLVIRGSELEID
jgi:hypothetical protein